MRHIHALLSQQLCGLLTYKVISPEPAVQNHYEHSYPESYSSKMSALDVLQRSFPAPQILMPGTPEFAEQNATYLAAQQSEIEPAAIFQPASKEDVSEFIKLVKPFTKDGFQFAIRGGGQNPLHGCANINKPGVTLDLARLNNVDIKEGYVAVGAGARWGAVFDALDGTGLGVSGNRSSKGGIGGLALQGMASRSTL